MLLSGKANVCEWFNDKKQKFQISVAATNKTRGNLFGYEGTFDA